MSVAAVCSVQVLFFLLSLPSGACYLTCVFADCSYRVDNIFTYIFTYRSSPVRQRYPHERSLYILYIMTIYRSARSYALHIPVAAAVVLNVLIYIHVRLAFDIAHVTSWPTLISTHVASCHQQHQHFIEFIEILLHKIKVYVNTHIKVECYLIIRLFFVVFLWFCN